MIFSWWPISAEPAAGQRGAGAEHGKISKATFTAKDAKDAKEKQKQGKSSGS